MGQDINKIDNEIDPSTFIQKNLPQFEIKEILSNIITNI